MVADLSAMSLADLEKLVAGRRSELDSLYKERESLSAKLKTVEEQIASLEGKGGIRASRPRHFTKAASGRGRKGPRGKNDKSLREVVTELLASNKKGFSLDDLSKAVLDTGYKTTSTNFKNTLYQCLYNAKEFQLDKKTGTYKIVAAKESA